MSQHIIQVINIIFMYTEKFQVKFQKYFYFHERAIVTCQIERKDEISNSLC